MQPLCSIDYFHLKLFSKTNWHVLNSIWNFLCYFEMVWFLLTFKQMENCNDSWFIYSMTQAIGLGNLEVPHWIINDNIEYSFFLCENSRLIQWSSDIMIMSEKMSWQMTVICIQPQVFARMNPYDLGRASCVCRKWRYTIRNPVFWRNACLKAWQVIGTSYVYEPFLCALYASCWF